LLNSCKDLKIIWKCDLKKINSEKEKQILFPAFTSLHFGLLAQFSAGPPFPPRAPSLGPWPSRAGQPLPCPALPLAVTGSRGPLVSPFPSPTVFPAHSPVKPHPRAARAHVSASWERLRAPRLPFKWKRNPASVLFPHSNFLSLEFTWSQPKQKSPESPSAPPRRRHL
jgi:hypothetical protein